MEELSDIEHNITLIMNRIEHFRFINERIFTNDIALLESILRSMEQHKIRIESTLAGSEYSNIYFNQNSDSESEDEK